MVSLRPVDDDNRAAVVALQVTPRQEQFVAGVAESLVEAVEDVGGRAHVRAVYAGGEPVGFTMWSDDVEPGGAYIAQYLWRLLIDERHQGRGYGRAVIEQVAAGFRAGGASAMWTSAGEGEGSPIGFYERCDFVQTGERVFDDEVLLRLDLGPRAG